MAITDIRLLTQDDYLLLMEITPDDEIMRGMFMSIAKSIKDGFDGISYTYAAFFDGIIVGFIYGFVLPNKSLLPQYLYVDPTYRKRGIGRKLLEALEINSGCVSSIAYFEKSLSQYYNKQGYIVGDAVVALKELKSDS